MCGALRLSASERLKIAPEVLVSSNLITPRTKTRLPFSSHRFIRKEKLDWWEKKTQLIYCMLKAEGIFEKNKYFAIPIGYDIRIAVHREVILDSNRWSISIITLDPISYTGSNVLTNFYYGVSRVHNRAPELVANGVW